VKTIRYTTLLKVCGKPVLASKLTESKIRKAVKENRIVTIHHKEGGNWCEPHWAEVGQHVLGVLDCLVFPKEIPVPYESLVLGVRRHIGLNKRGSLVL
jgi:hypothetical protein